MECFCLCLQVCTSSEAKIKQLGIDLPLRPDTFNCVPHTTLLQGVVTSFQALQESLSSSSARSALNPLHPLLQHWDQDLQQSDQLVEQNFDMKHRVTMLAYRHGHLLRSISIQLLELVRLTELICGRPTSPVPKPLSTAYRYCFDYQYKAALGLISPHTTIGFSPFSASVALTAPKYLPEVRHSGLVLASLNEFCMTPRSALHPLITW